MFVCPVCEYEGLLMLSEDGYLECPSCGDAHILPPGGYPLPGYVQIWLTADGQVLDVAFRKGWRRTKRYIIATIRRLAQLGVDKDVAFYVHDPGVETDEVHPAPYVLINPARDHALFERLKSVWEIRA